MARYTAAALLGLVASLGCSPDFDSPSRLKSLRVLAVQKDKPYARPGDTVTLKMLLDDPAHPEPRGVKIGWFAGCVNPPGDLYAGCFAELAGVKLPGRPEPKIQVGQGLTFSFQVPEDIISGWPRQQLPRQVPYGIAYVFFTACPGEVRIVPPEGTDVSTLPVQCIGSSGEQLGADDFVIGYTAVFAYDKLTNKNPIITGFKLEGSPIAPECIGDACVALEAEELGFTLPGADGGAGDGGSMKEGGLLGEGGRLGDAGLLGDAGPFGDGGAADGGSDGGQGGKKPAPTPRAPKDPCDDQGFGCFDVCTEAKLSDCPKHEIEVELDPKSAEHDTALEASDGKTLLEQMWVNYYVDAGKLQGDVKLLNDATLGWNDKHATKVLVPRQAGMFHLWAVAHDNRGGTQWARLLLSAH